MISLSNVIKPTGYIAMDAFKMIATQLPYEQISIPQPVQSEEQPGPEEHPEVQEAQQLSQQIIQDAEHHAEQLIQEAQEQCSRVQEATRQEIDVWWQASRQEDEQVTEQARAAGYDAGYQSGYQEVQTELQQQYAEMIREAQTVLQRAIETKQQIIQEAEPFLLELSVAIAEKIVDEHVSVNQDWITQYIQKLLAGRREQGTITICVSPAQYQYMTNAREELAASAGAHRELIIVPDAGVTDVGCIIRTSFGSIDATIGTQLQEIKSALQQIAVQQEVTTDED